MVGKRNVPRIYNHSKLRFRESSKMGHPRSLFGSGKLVIRGLSFIQGPEPEGKGIKGI